GLSIGFERHGIPEANCQIVVGGGEKPSVGAEGRGEGTAPAKLVRQARPGSQRIEEPHPVVTARDGERISVGAESDPGELARGLNRWSDTLAGARVPELSRLIRTGGRDQLTVGAEGQGTDAAAMLKGGYDGRKRGRIA